MKAVLTKLAFLILFSKEAAGQCDTGIYVNKTHTWNKGYLAKLYLDQSWLTQQTSDWKLTITFCNEVGEFKVWSADIINPATNNKYVNNVSMVEIMNMCWNSILYPCQDLELAFMVRFPEGGSDDLSCDYDIVAVTETVTYNDGSTGNRTYCPLLADSLSCTTNTNTAKTTKSTTKKTTTTSTTTTTTTTAADTPSIRIIKTVIEENGELFEQLDRYNNETGEVSIEVPPHGEREQLQILLDPISDTLVANTPSKCQIKNLPQGVNPLSLASSADKVESRDEVITEDAEQVKHSITMETGEAMQEDLDKLSPAAHAVCGNKKVFLTEERLVTVEAFENLTLGGIIDIGPGSGRRKRDSPLANCSLTRMCGKRTSGCWRWPYGTDAFSIHHLNLDVLCVECCDDGTSTADMCDCSYITTLSQLEQCTKPYDGSCPDGFYLCGGQCKVEVGAPTEKCNGSCPQSRVPCGDMCIPANWSSKIYHYKQWRNCNGKCVKGNRPCNGICPFGGTACGDQCVNIGYGYRMCDEVCITGSMPCNGNCVHGSSLCGEVCKRNDGNWRSCNGVCVYKTVACDGTCPVGSSLCGNSNRCIAPDDQSYKECNGECIPYLVPCNNVCPFGTKECNGLCVSNLDPCNGECHDRMIFCNNTEYYILQEYRTNHAEGYCVLNDGYTYKCGDDCLHTTQKCNGSCTDGWTSCSQEDSGIIYSTANYNYKDVPQCMKEKGIYRECNGECIPDYKSCNRECPEGHYYCEEWNACIENYYRCNNTCPEGWELCGGWGCMKDGSPDSLYRSCGDKCIDKYFACNGTCLAGMDVCGYEGYNSWQGQTLLCHTASSINQPCNGVCLTNGTSCDGQCPGGFKLCTLGNPYYGDQEVCYNDSLESIYIFYNGYCWYQARNNVDV